MANIANILLKWIRPRRQGEHKYTPHHHGGLHNCPEVGHYVVWGMVALVEPIDILVDDQRSDSRTYNMLAKE